MLSTNKQTMPSKSGNLVKVKDVKGGIYTIIEISAGVVMDENNILYAQHFPIVVGQVIPFRYTEQCTVVEVIKHW